MKTRALRTLQRLDPDGPYAQIYDAQHSRVRRYMIETEPLRTALAIEAAKGRPIRAVLAEFAAHIEAMRARMAKNGARIGLECVAGQKEG